MRMIELPEGNFVVVDYIEVVGPRFEYEKQVEGASIIMVSGAVITTDETVERVLHQIAEVVAQE